MAKTFQLAEAEQRIFELIEALERFTADHQRKRWQGKELCLCGPCAQARVAIKAAKA